MRLQTGKHRDRQREGETERERERGRAATYLHRVLAPAEGGQRAAAVAAVPLVTLALILQALLKRRYVCCKGFEHRVVLLYGTD